MPPTIAQKPPKQNKNLRDILSTRGGSAGLAAVTAVLAAVLLLVFITKYRDSVNNDNKNAPVLVAQQLIQKGSSGDIIATQGLYQSTSLKKSDLKTGAISDPSLLRGKVATTDILPGEQLTASDFAVSGNAVQDRLSGDFRAIAIPLDSAHGILGDLQTGDRVDVIGVYNSTNNSGTIGSVARMLLQNVLVLRAPAADPNASTGAGVNSTGTKTVVLQVPDDQATKLAWSVENGTLWITERPKIGARQSQPGLVGVTQVLLGTKPVNPQQARSLLNQLSGRR